MEEIYKEIERNDVGSNDEDPSTSATPLMQTAVMVPKDRCGLSFSIFYLLGLGSLLPWNFFITANEYWMYKLRDVNNSIPNVTTISPIQPNGTVNMYNNFTSESVQPSYNTLQSLFMNSMALCAMLPNVVFQFLNTILQKRIPQNARVIGTLVLMIILFIITEVFVRIDVSSWQMTFFFVTLISVALINSCSAVFQSSVFGLAACFPQKFSAALMAGQGMGGVFAALAMIVALAYSNSPTDSAFIFFLTAIAVLTLTLILYCFLIKLDFYLYFYKRISSEKKDVELNSSGEKDPCIDRQSINGDVWEKRNNGNNAIEPFVNSGETGSEYVHVTTDHDNVPLLHVVKKIWLHMFCIVYTFFITLACFPAVTAFIESTSSGTQWSDVYFTPVCCFLLFNVSDWIGRSIASYIHIPSPESKAALLILVLSRTVFPFLFAFCNVQPRQLPVFFHNDAFFIVFMALFGISNGHLSTLCMQYGPKRVELAHATTAGSMLAFMISVGLLAGAGFSFIVKMCI